MRLTSAHRRGALTPALPAVYPALANAGLRLRHGQVSLTVAAPGAGKSMCWMNIAMRTGVPTIYWSADTDSHDVLLRATALWSGIDAEKVEQFRKEPKSAEWFDRKLAQGAHVDWVFDSTITAKVLAERLNAHAELHGEYPSLVVLDNLSNVVTDQDSELAQQKAFIKDALDIAQETQAHVAILTHASGEYDRGDRPIPLDGVLNKLGKIPSVVLTLFRANESGSELGVVIAKNRGGQPDPAARRPIHLQVDFAKAAVYGWGNE